MSILTTTASATPEHEKEQQRMLSEIEESVRQTRAYIGKDTLDSRVLQAMARVPRHRYVPEPLRQNAYVNSALPIAHGQTISQPYIVALMTDLAAVDEASVVLEVGTGSGYQAAVLAELVDTVYTIEIVAPLAEQAAATLADAGYKNIRFRTGDGYHGWPEAAPFDAILVTAATATVPAALLDQLKPGGRLVLPLGEPHMTQTLTVIEKGPDNRLLERAVLPVGFVPLTRE